MYGDDGDAAARTVDEEYGVGTGVDEGEKAAKMAVVKSRLTRQLASGVIKARARYYRLRLERACTLARSRLLALEAAPIEPGLLGDTTMHHASSSAFDNPADDDGAYGAHPELGDPDMHGLDLRIGEDKYSRANAYIDRTTHATTLHYFY